MRVHDSQFESGGSGTTLPAMNISKTILVALVLTVPGCQATDDPVGKPETASAETASPETASPETASPETASAETANPETTSPETTSPETTSPETTSPETASPETASLETASPETASPETASPETTSPETTSPETTSPETASPAGDPVATELPLIFEDDFENGRDRWEATDEKSWTHRAVDGNHVFGINRRNSDYKPKVRSPRHIALIKNLKAKDLIITFRVRSTKDTGNHRDCCVFFNYQDPQNYYYVHLGAKPDPHSGQIMIVKGAPRLAITKNEKMTPWDDDWHRVKLVRDFAKGTIEVYFDDMETPHMTAVDATFGEGRIGIGSFDDMNDFDDIKIYGR